VTQQRPSQRLLRVRALPADKSAYGDSRTICGVQHASDVEAGRIVGSALFAALKADPAFKATFATARLELVRERRRAR